MLSAAYVVMHVHIRRYNLMMDYKYIRINLQVKEILPQRTLPLTIRTTIF